MIRKLYTLILIIIVSAGVVQGQYFADKFSEAKKLYDETNYAEAYKLFGELIDDENENVELTASAKYYSALCLFNLDLIEGSIAELEDFVSKCKFSNLMDEALYKLATIYYQQGRYYKSREKLYVLLKFYPNSFYTAEAYYWVGKSFQMENNFIDAEEYLKESVSQSTGNQFVDYALYSLGTLYEENNQYADAVTYYDELLAYYRDSDLAPFAQLRIGASFFNLKEYDKAVLELSDPLIAELPDSMATEANYLLASSFFRLKEFENAANTYEKLLNNYKNSSVQREVEYGLAWISFQVEDYEEAYRLFYRLAMEGIDTIAVKSLYWSAECLRYLDKIPKAVDLYNDFLQKYPADKLAYKVNFNLGIIEYGKRELKVAQRYLIKATNSSDPSVKGKAYSLLGEISLQNKEYREAESYFKTAINSSVLIEDVSRTAILGLGITEFYLDKYDESINNLSDLLARYPGFENDKINFYLAESYLARKSYSTAIKHYYRVGDNNAELKRLSLFGRAYSYFNMKDFANAAAFFRDYLSLYKNDENYTDAKLRLADSYYGLKDFRKAGEIYGEIYSKRRLAPDDDFGYYQYAQSLYKSGKTSDAISEFRELQRKFPRSNYADDSQYLIGWIRFQNNEFQKAIDSYDEIFTRYPNTSLRPIAVYSIGDSYYNLGDYDKALEKYLNLLDQYSNTRFIFDAINGIQYCYMAKNQPEDAITVIDRFIVDNPRSEFADEIMMKKGEIYYSLASYQKAIESYKEFIVLFPTSSLVPEAYYWIGKSYANLNNSEEAIDNFQLVTKNYLDSKYGIDAVVELGDLYVSLKQYPVALELYNSSLPKIKDEKRKPEIMFKKAMVQIEQDDIVNAYATLNEIVNYYEGSIFSDKAKIELSLMEIARNEYANAENLLKELGQKRSDDIGAQAQYLYGVVLFEQEKYDDAIIALVRVRSVFPNYDYWYSKSLIALGDCYTKTNDKRRAREMFRAVIQKHSNDELGAEARNKLNKI